MYYLHTFDGLQLEVWQSLAENCDTDVVFINALGISNAITHTLGNAVNKLGANFTTWNRRGFPGDYSNNFREYTPQHSIRDLQDLIEQFSLKNIILATWCTGAQVALGAIATGIVQPQYLVLFNNPNYFNTGYSEVQGDAIGKISQSIVTDENKLDFFFEIITKSIVPVDSSAHTGSEHLTKEQQQLIQAPFTESKEGLLRYAHLICNGGNLQETRKWCGRINIPTKLVAGKKDHMVSYLDAIHLEQIIPKSSVDIMPDWGHYTLFTQPITTAEKILTRGK